MKNNSTTFPGKSGFITGFFKPKFDCSLQYPKGLHFVGLKGTTEVKFCSVASDQHTIHLNLQFSKNSLKLSQCTNCYFCSVDLSDLHCHFGSKWFDHPSIDVPTSFESANLAVLSFLGQCLLLIQPAKDLSMLPLSSSGLEYCLYCTLQEREGKSNFAMGCRNEGIVPSDKRFQCEVMLLL